MRDLLDKLNNLEESTGLAGRRQGDVFRNATGEEITFNGLEFFPAAGGTLSKEELDALVKKIEAKPGFYKWLNPRSARSGGLAVASFTKDRKEMLVGRFLQQINPNPVQNYLPNQIDDYQYSTKAQAALGPQDLLTDLKDQTIPQVMNQLAKSLGTDSPLYEVAHKIAMGVKLPYTIKVNKGASFSAFRDYFGEILQPMALQKGLYTGNAGEAAEKFLGSNGFAGTTITWETSKNAGLSDSTLKKPGGATINLSSKGGAGAMASVGNIANVVDKLLEAEAEQKTKSGSDLVSRYSGTLDLIRKIKELGQNEAPFYVATKFGVITQGEADQVRALKNSPPMDINGVDKLALSSKLKGFAKERQSKRPDNVLIYYHLLAVIAKKAAEAVNEGTNFSEAAADILNNGALVQVYTKATDKGDTWTLDEFNTRYPGETVKGVYLTAGKGYTGTYPIKGNFTFKIDKGTGVPKDDDTEVDTSAAPSTDQLPAEPGSKRSKEKISDIFKQAVGSDTGDDSAGSGRKKRWST